MKSKGEVLGGKKFVTRKRDSCPNRVANTIELPDWDVESGETVIVDVFREGACIDSYEADIYENSTAITLKKRVVVENDIEPGEVLSIEVCRAVTTTYEGTEVIDTVPTVKDPQNPDGLDARLHSKKVCEYLGSDEMFLKFYNTSNGKSALGKSRADYKKETTFYFPSEVRSAIDATTEDTIQVIRPSQDESLDNVTKEQIEEMHDMISELYDAYTEVKND